jgi:hypothetical protein
MKPILFLDVDDTLIAYPKAVPGNHVPEFIRWAKEHFEVRWLTMWAVSGEMDSLHAAELAKILGVPVKEIAEIRNPHGFKVIPIRLVRDENWRDKSVSIRAALAETPGREWAWVEDPHLTPWERDFIAANPNRYFNTSSSRNPGEVVVTANRLALRFDLPRMAV